MNITNVNVHQRQFLKTYINRDQIVWLPKRGLETTQRLLFRRLESFFKPYFGAHGAREIPVLIPNTEVKPCSGDYTATSGKLARCRIIREASE